MRTSNLTRSIVALTATVGMLSTAGCADSVTDDDTNVVAEPHNALPGDKADQWGKQDDPSLFSADLEYRAAELPREGAAANTPWAGNYWPTYQDNINYRWDGAESASPAAKFGEAFAVADLEDAVSKQYGIDAYASRTECSDDEACDSKIGERCSKRLGEEKGRCIPTWWGICHAWAPVAIMEPEPVHPVTRNGVTFKVNDIKALLTLAWDQTKSKFLSLRCNEDDSADGITYDEYGNPTGSDIECKDTNAGTFHVVVANYLGLKGESFVEDRTFDDEVWNQPVAAYRVSKFDEVTAAQANELAGVQPTLGSGGTEKNLSEAVAKDAWHHAGSFDIPAGGSLKVTLKSAKDADLYVRVGGEPTATKHDCRPWLGGGADELCQLDGSPDAVTTVFVSVHGYEAADFDLSIRVMAGDAGVPTEYVFNDEATQFFNVKMELDYISESPAGRDGNLASTISRYTHTDTYTYILEVGADGKVQGGEWTGASKKAHPDFLWLPTGRGTRPIAGGKISYSLIKSLLDESVNGPSTAKTVVDNHSGNVATNAWFHIAPIKAASGAVEIVMTGTGDADLYVRKGSQPTTRDYDCRPYVDGSAESCIVEGPGEIYISVRGYRAADFELKVVYKSDDGATPTDPAPEPEVRHLDESGSLAQGELKGFTLEVVAGRAVVITTTAAADIDLYAKYGQAPTTASYDARAWTYSGNETIRYTPTSSGTLHIAVHGYEASAFVLKTADQ